MLSLSFSSLMAERYHILGRMIPCGTFCPIWWKLDAEPTKCWASDAGKGVWTLQGSCWRRQPHRVEFGVQFYILPEPAVLAGSSSPALTSVHLPQLQPLLLYWTELHGLLTAQQFNPNEGSNCQWWEKGRGNEKTIKFTKLAAVWLMLQPMLFDLMQKWELVGWEQQESGFLSGATHIYTRRGGKWTSRLLLMLWEQQP